MEPGEKQTADKDRLLDELTRKVKRLELEIRALEKENDSYAKALKLG